MVSNISSRWPNILVVDDVQNNCELLQVYLTTFEQVNVITATSGKEALIHYRNTEFALIILDIDMPVMDGFELARQMKLLKSEDKTPLIYLSGNAENSKFASLGYDLGAVDYILKPFDLKFVLQKVKVFLNLYQQKKVLENEVIVKTHSENKLIKENKASQSILEESQDCILTLNSTGKIETINLACVKLLEADDAQQLISIQINKLVQSSDRSLFLSCLNRVLNNESVKVKIKLQTVQNNSCCVELSLSPMVEEGKVKRIVCLVTKTVNSD